MPYELENQDTLEIYLDKNTNVKAVKGKCKAKDFSKQIETLKEVFQ